MQKVEQTMQNNHIYPGGATTSDVTQLYLFSHIFCKKIEVQKDFNTIRNNHVYTGGAATSDVTQLYYCDHIFCAKTKKQKIEEI